MRVAEDRPTGLTGCGAEEMERSTLLRCGRAEIDTSSAPLEPNRHEVTSLRIVEDTHFMSESHNGTYVSN